MNREPKPPCEPMRLRVRPVVTGGAIAFVLVSGSLGPTLGSHEPPRLGLTPVGANGPYFDLTLEGGEAAHLEVQLANSGHADVLARTYAADAYSIVNGGFGARLFGEPTSETTRWLTYETREAMLGPGEAINLDLRVEVPINTAPGEYIAALVAENATPYREGEGSVALDQVNRVAVAVAIDVPGPARPNLTIGAMSHAMSAGTSHVSFKVRNLGNVHLKPTGDFALRDAQGNEMAATAAIMDSLYAGSATRFEAPLASALLPGSYCAELSLRDDATGASAASECLPFIVETAAAADENESRQGAAGISVAEPSTEPAVHPLSAAMVGIAIAGALCWGLLGRQRGRRTGPG